MNNLRHIIDDAFSEMAAVLPQLLQDGLQEHLADGQHWTDLLKVLDQDRGIGKPSNYYNEGDPRLQLRMVTERLGSLGYPFDDSTRETSARGQLLRNTASRLAHWENVPTPQVLEVVINIERVLARLGDSEADKRLGHLKKAAGWCEIFDEDPTKPKGTDDLRVSAEHVLAQPHANPPKHAGSAAQFGTKSDLKNRLGSARRKKVREAIQYVADGEWPIELDLLVKGTAECFEYQRVPQDIRAKIEHQVQSLADEGVLHISLNSTVWPSRDAEEAWTKVRSSAHSDQQPTRLPKYAQRQAPGGPVSKSEPQRIALASPNKGQARCPQFPTRAHPHAHFSDEGTQAR